MSRQENIVERAKAGTLKSKTAVNYFSILAGITLIIVLILVVGVFMFTTYSDYGGNVLIDLQWIIDSFATKTPTLTSTPTLTPTLTPTITLTPSITPTSTKFSTWTIEPTLTIPPIAPEWKWVWQSLPLYNWEVEIPMGWGIYTVDRSPDQTGILGHDYANYEIVSNRGDMLTTKILFGAYGGEGPYPCTFESILIDPERSIGRIELLPGSGYSYTKIYHGQDNLLYCDEFGWKIENDIVISIFYSNSHMSFDLPTVDRIVLSIRPK